jgi:DNA-directed RNA polymerase specialized sigma24 family protein
MATTRATQEELLDELVRLLALQVRYLFPSQAEASVALSKAGFKPSRIAQLLGTTTSTVTTDLQRARKAKAAKKKSSS